jgi:protein involved in polysaccharide export with SLBB domain
LKDGDVITIPDEPTTVSITGAVLLPSAVSFKKGQDLDYYIQRAGGLTADAAIGDILVIRATGGVLRYKKGTRIELGDNVLIPTKVQSVRLRESANALQTITQTVASAGLTFALIRALAR